MAEGHQRNILHFDGVAFYAVTVFYHFYRVVILTVFGYRILVVQISAQIAVTGHRIQPHRDIFGVQTALQIIHIFQSAVVERTELAPSERGMHAVVGTGVTAPYTASV